MTLPKYPARQPFFSHRFCRLMAKVCLAGEVGPETCWMLTVIVQTEDAGGYRRPVNFHNWQLASVCGFGSEDKLARTREKAIKAGWLHYIPGSRGMAARYWVLVPRHAQGIDDEPSDERPGDYQPEEPADAESQDASEPAPVREKPRRNRGESAESPRLECGTSYPIPKQEEVEGKSSCDQPASPAPLAVIDPPLMTFPCVGKGPNEWPLTAAKAEEWVRSFPGVDVEAQLRKARQWLIDNPTRRKTFAGMTRFIGNWLGRCQNAPAAPGSLFSGRSDFQTEYAQRTFLSALQAQEQGGSDGEQ